MNKLASPRSQLILSMLIFGSIGVVRRYIPFPSSVVALVRPGNPSAPSPSTKICRNGTGRIGCNPAMVTPCVR